LDRSLLKRTTALTVFPGRQFCLQFWANTYVCFWSVVHNLESFSPDLEVTSSGPHTFQGDTGERHGASPPSPRRHQPTTPIGAWVGRPLSSHQANNANPIPLSSLWNLIKRPMLGGQPSQMLCVDRRTRWPMRQSSDNVPPGTPLRSRRSFDDDVIAPRNMPHGRSVAVQSLGGRISESIVPVLRHTCV
jgi:hypothetical protein